MKSELARVLPGDPWPGGISNGLDSECEDCHSVPVLDYTVDDYFWSRHGAGAYVLCLRCLHFRCGGVGLPEAIQRIQVIGGGETTVLTPAERYDYRALKIS